MPVISGYITNKLFDLQETDDIVQKAFIKLYKSIPRFDEKRPLLPYLFEIAKNELKMYFRSHREKVGLTQDVSVFQENALKEYELEDMIKDLPKDQRKAIGMIYEGFSYEEIAKNLKKPLNTIRTIIRRARLKLIEKNK